MAVGTGAGPVRKTGGGRAAAADFLSMDELLTAEERAVRDAVAAFVDAEVRPLIADCFDAGRFPTELIPGIARLGVLGMHLSGYGCAGASAAAYGVANREFEAGDSAIRSFVSVQGSLAMFPIFTYGSEEQKQQWLPRMAAGEAVGCFGLTEPDAGSDPASMRSTARREGGDWVLSGSKMWITNGSIADVAVVWARTGSGVAGFLVEKGMRGFTATDIPHKYSLRASVTSTLHLDDVRVPESSRLPLASGLSAPLSCLTEARYGIAWGATGVARDCLLAALSYAGSRTVFGRALSGTQLAQERFADMVTRLSAASAIAVRLSQLKEAGRLVPAQVSLGKRHNVRVALDIARASRMLLGANGITLDYPPLRHAMNLESVITYEGTEEVHTLVLGQALTGISAFGGSSDGDS